MSGSSLDGLDLCLTRFWSSVKQLNHQIVEAKTIQFPDHWLEKLSNSHRLSAYELYLLDREFGQYLGIQSKLFLEENQLQANLIASHGHTVFHQPKDQLSVQIGHGAYIAAASGLDVVNDLRSGDLAYGGEGAPLVPLAEQWLFKSNSCFLNLGGIANLSIHKKDGKVIGYDVCVANQILNWISNTYFGKDYDQDGILASQGKVIKELLASLNQLEFYQEEPPRSLGREDVEAKLIPLCKPYSDGSDLLCTFTHHIADQISIEFERNRAKDQEVLLSGGGSYNHYLLQILKEKGVKIKLPDPQIIDFKEALCFALLGYLRIQGIPNSLSSVTGARKDVVNGSHFVA